MGEINANTGGLWSLFTLERDYGRAKFDKLRDPRDGRDVADPVLSRLAFGDGAGVRYPGGEKFAVCLSHDIDDLYPPVTHKILSTPHLAKGLQMTDLRNLWQPVRGGVNRSPYRNFKKIMDLEESFGARSSFYFLATDRDIRRFRYDLAELAPDIGTIADRGWEVGLHGGYYAFDDPGEILEEKRKLDRILGKKSVGYRNHYLQFKVPETWEYLEAAGFRYDSTIGYSNAVGFPNGACHPFRPYDLRRGKLFDIFEIPLAIMDGGLLEQAGSPAAAFELARSVLDRVEQCGGVAMVLWHNTSFGPGFREARERLYRKILAYCRERGAWMTSGEEIWKWSERNIDPAWWQRAMPEDRPGGPGGTARAAPLIQHR